jgi:uncharacterized damage-inducible protein DinB
MNEFIKESLASLDTQLLIIETAINRLSEEDIWKKFKEEMNSVGNLCLHLAGSEYAFISSIIGGMPLIRKRSNEFTDYAIMNGKELVENLKNVRYQSKEVIEKMDYSDLAREIYLPASSSTVTPEPSKTQSCLSVVLYVIEHYSFHTGQIVYITKLLQSNGEHLLKWKH